MHPSLRVIMKFVDSEAAQRSKTVAFLPEALRNSPSEPSFLYPFLILLIHFIHSLAFYISYYTRPTTGRF
jgi:hypothetical protein